MSVNFKTIVTEWLNAEDVLYIDIFMKNGISFNLFKPNTGSTLNVEALDDYIRVFGNVSDTNSMNSIVPYENISHLNVTFGEEQPAEAPKDNSQGE